MPQEPAHMIHMPAKLPGFRAAAILWGIYAALWISLEGAVWRATLMGVWSVALLLGNLWQAWARGRAFGWFGWISVWGALGGMVGILSVPATLFFMALKTGLHAHGAEFSAAQIDQTAMQWGLWGIVGVFAGIGSGSILAWRLGETPSEQDQ